MAVFVFDLPAYPEAALQLGINPARGPELEAAGAGSGVGDYAL
jgi:hypothetical protein